MVTENLKELCKKYRLDATPKLWAATETQIKCIYNGAGTGTAPNRQFRNMNGRMTEVV